MDYSKLSKKELIELCKKRNIDYSSNMLKIELEKLLINNEGGQKEKQDFKNKKNYYSEPNYLGKIGVVLNIIFSSIFLLVSIIITFKLILGGMHFLNKIDNIGEAIEKLSEKGINQTFIIVSILIYFIIIIIGSICSIVSNSRFLKGKENKVMTGVLSLFFSGFIGGILVLASKKNNIGKNN